MRSRPLAGQRVREMDWLQRIAGLVDREGAAARVVIVEATGPTPRAAGTGMLVTMTLAEGKIGRGSIEREAIAAARELIARLGSPDAAPRWPRAMLVNATGPVLGETSGGIARLAIEAYGPAEIAALSRLRRSDQADPILARRLETGSPPAFLSSAGARAQSDAGWAPALRRLAADPLLSLSLVTEPDGVPAIVERVSPHLPPFHVYGTGLVARALVRQLAGLPFDTAWIDAEPAHFPDAVPAGVRLITHADISEFARRSPAGAFHAVMTASHDLDLAVCLALLEADAFTYLGVIGSRLKHERLMARLADEGVPRDRLARLVCPIGLPDIRSKHPAVIAVSIAAQALIALQARHAVTKR